MLAAADAAAELIELGQAEPVRALNDHNSCIGYVHSNFNNGSRY